MGMWKNLSVTKRMIIGLSVQAALLGTVSLWAFSVTQSTAQTVDRLQQHDLVLSETAHAMRLDVANIWQWLSDISATRARDGLDDGFQQAQARVDAFRKHLASMRALYAEESETLETLARIDDDLGRFHVAGVAMARAYIEGGAEAGNHMMGGFDEAAEQLQGELGPFIERQVAGTRQTVDATVAQLNHFIQGIQLVCGVAFVALLATGVLLARSVTRPLADQLVVVEAVAQGDLTTIVTVDRGDEFGRLAQGLRRMVENLRSTVGSVIDLSRALAATSEEMSAATQQISVSTEEVSAQTQAMAGSAQQMNASVHDISSRVETVSASTVRVTEASTNGEAVVAQTSGAIARIQDVVDAVETTIRHLGERSERIGTVVDAIEDIADQTNLLALNAAIEAARAGEQGRGFAVVADEVRKLAEKTVAATREITETVGAIRDEVAQAVTKTSETVEAVQEGGRLGEQTTAAMKLIGTEARATSGQAGEIATVSRQLTAAIEVLTTNTDEVSRASEQNSTATEQLSQTAGELARRAEELRALADRFRV